MRLLSHLKLNDGQEIHLHQHYKDAGAYASRRFQKQSYYLGVALLSVQARHYHHLNHATTATSSDHLTLSMSLVNCSIHLGSLHLHLFQDYFLIPPPRLSNTVMVGRSNLKYALNEVQVFSRLQSKTY